MRLALIGNSHLAMLILAWDRIGTQHQDIQVRFFGAGAEAMNSCMVRNGRLEPPGPGIAQILSITSGGLTSVDFRDYDALVFYGLHLFVPRLEVRMSAAVRDAAIAGTVEAAVSVNLAERVRASCDIPQIIVPNPLFAAVPMLVIPSHKMLPYTAILAAIENRIAKKVAKVTVLGQPEPLVRSDLLTDLAWSKGSTRLAVREGMTDTETHGNV